jgi:transcriptional regulator with XRE-family HTH domain
MADQDQCLSVVERLMHQFSDWLKHRRELSEMRQLSATEFDRIASELQVSRTDLDELVRRGPHAADELPRLLKALGISESELARVAPLLLHDMERVCALCGQKRECDRDLAAGTSASSYQNYCLNAPTLNELSESTRK